MDGDAVGFGLKVGDGDGWADIDGFELELGIGDGRSDGDAVGFWLTVGNCDGREEGAIEVGTEDGLIEGKCDGR